MGKNDIFLCIGECRQEVFTGEPTLFQKIVSFFKDDKYSWLFLNGQHGRVSNRKLGKTIERLGEEILLNYWEEDKKGYLPYIKIEPISRKEAERIIDSWDVEDCDNGDLGRILKLW